MAIKRVIELLDTVADVLPEKTLEWIEDNHPELIEIEWEITILSFSKGLDAVYYPNDKAHPAEPSEYQIEETPTAVACMITKQLMTVLPEKFWLINVFSMIWNAIYDEEQRWQDRNLDEEIHNEMWGE